GVAGTGEGGMGGTPLCTKRPVHHSRAHEWMREREADARNHDKPSLLGRSQLLNAQVGRLERPHDGRAVLPVTERHHEQSLARLHPECADAGKNGTLRGSAGYERVAEWDAPNALVGRKAERDLA